MSITKTKINFVFSKFQGSSLIEQEKFLLDELRQIREDQEELEAERETLNEQLVIFMEEKHIVEHTLPNEIKRLKKIQSKVQNEAAQAEITLKNQQRQMSFYLKLWMQKFQQKKALKKILRKKDNSLDPIKYFRLWSENSQVLSKKLKAVLK